MTRAVHALERIADALEASGQPRPEDDPIAYGIALLWKQGPDANVKEIARLIGRNATSLYRNRRFKYALEKVRGSVSTRVGSVHRGFNDGDGNLEAVSE